MNEANDEQKLRKAEETTDRHELGKRWRIRQMRRIKVASESVQCEEQKSFGWKGDKQNEWSNARVKKKRDDKPERRNKAKSDVNLLFKWSAAKSGKDERPRVRINSRKRFKSSWLVQASVGSSEQKWEKSDQDVHKRVMVSETNGNFKVN